MLRTEIFNSVAMIDYRSKIAGHEPRDFLSILSYIDMFVMWCTLTCVSCPRVCTLTFVTILATFVFTDGMTLSRPQVGMDIDVMVPTGKHIKQVGENYSKGESDGTEAVS